MINKCRYVYHCLPVNLSLTLIFTIKRNEEIMLSRPFPVRRKQKNGNRPQTGRHVSPADIPFHRQVIIPDGEKQKRTPLFL